MIHNNLAKTTLCINSAKNQSAYQPFTKGLLSTAKGTSMLHYAKTNSLLA